MTIQAQTERSRSANQAQNHQKLYDELMALYSKTVPAESSPDKARKYEALYVLPDPSGRSCGEQPPLTSKGITGRKPQKKFD